MITLKTDIRNEKASRTRKKGKIPAILYGKKIENQNLEIEKKELEKIIKLVKETEKIEIQVNKEKVPVLIKEIQKCPINGEILHVDFFQPSFQEEIEGKFL
jgi:large subunit ribosomal protein L25